MEAKKKVSVLEACLLTLLLSGQPKPVSGSSRYCKCFRKCYKHCRDDDHQPRPVCSSQLVAGGSSCREVCLASVGCSKDATATGGDGPIDADVAACVDGCTG